MTKTEIIEKFCALSGEVACEVFHWKHASDCFCEKSIGTASSFQYEKEVFEFIEKAVKEAIEKHTASVALQK